MLKDQVPVAGNSADKRRPLIMVSPRERQKKRNAAKVEKYIKSLEEQIAFLTLELETRTKDYELTIATLTKLTEVSKVVEVVASKSKKKDKVVDIDIVESIIE